MNKTTNYQLNQWEATDQVRRTDFNEDNAKIDAAIQAVDGKVDGKADTSALEAVQAALAEKGNCVLKTGSYTGTGLTSKTLTLGSTRPKLLIVMGGSFHAIFIPQSEYTSCVGGTYGRSITVTWTADGLSWYSTHSSDSSECLNASGTTYCYFAFY